MSPSNSSGAPWDGDVVEATQHRVDARHELGGREGFHDVVVGAEAQAHHAVGLLALGGEQDDRRVVAVAIADPSHHVEALYARQHQVQHHQVGRPLRDLSPARNGRRGPLACRSRRDRGSGTPPRRSSARHPPRGSSRAYAARGSYDGVSQRRGAKRTCSARCSSFVHDRHRSQRSAGELRHARGELLLRSEPKQRSRRARPTRRRGGHRRAATRR